MGVRRSGSIWGTALLLGWISLLSQAQGASTYSWYDGNTERKVVIQKDLVAEFDEGSSSPSRSSGRSGVRSEISGAELQSKQSSSVRIWKLPKGTSAGSAVQKLSEANPDVSYSPVMREGSRGNGRQMALPGNVIVTFKPDWTETQIEQWAKRHRYVILRRLKSLGNMALVETPSGLESLKIANQVYQSGEVVSASPDWWKETDGK